MVKILFCGCGSSASSSKKAIPELTPPAEQERMRVVTSAEYVGRRKIFGSVARDRFLIVAVKCISVDISRGATRALLWKWLDIERLSIVQQTRQLVLFGFEKVFVHISMQLDPVAIDARPGCGRTAWSACSGHRRAGLNVHGDEMFAANVPRLCRQSVQGDTVTFALSWSAKREIRDDVLGYRRIAVMLCTNMRETRRSSSRVIGESYMQCRARVWGCDIDIVCFSRPKMNTFLRRALIYPSRRYASENRSHHNPNVDYSTRAFL